MELSAKNPFSGLFFQICRIIDMYVFLVVFDGAELKNKCFNTWNWIVCPFSVGFTTLEAFLGLNQGGGGMLDLELIFSKKKFAPKFIFIRCWLHFRRFLYFGSHWGWGRVEHFPRFSTFLLIFEFDWLWQGSNNEGHISGHQQLFCEKNFLKKKQILANFSDKLWEPGVWSECLILFN